MTSDAAASSADQVSSNPLDSESGHPRDRGDNIQDDPSGNGGLEVEGRSSNAAGIGSGPQEAADGTVVGALLGAATWLMMHSPEHRHLLLSDLEWRLLPPLRLGQCRLFQERGKPVAFVTWARLTEEVEARCKSRTARLKPNEWNDGERIYVVDVVTPFGGRTQVLDAIRDVLGQPEADDPVLTGPAEQ